MDAIKSMSPCELIVLGTLLAVVICDNRSASDLNILGNFVVAIGGLILTWAAQKEAQNDACNPDNSAAQLEEMKKQIKALQKKYAELKMPLSPNSYHSEG